MSRTYRNQRRCGWWDENPLVKPHECECEIIWEDTSKVTIDRNYMCWSTLYTYYRVEYKPDSPTGRRLLAQARRDKVIRFKEPGPSWFRNLFEERPLRRCSKREIQRYMKDEEYEPLIDPKPRKKIYWT